MDVGVLECSMHPQPLEDRLQHMDCPCAAAPLQPGQKPSHPSASSQGARTKEARSLFPDPFGCDGDAPAACCMPEDQGGSSLFAPCMVCAMRPASIIEVPCGHATVCAECFGDYHTNVRCLRCRDQVTGRVDVFPFLHEPEGRPPECNMCKSNTASVVTLPCVHMCLCANCLPWKPNGCPTCGALVEQTCVVRWSTGSETTRPGPSSFPRLPATFGSLARGGGEGLAKATEDVDQEIQRLERQLMKLKLRSVSQTSSRSVSMSVGGQSTVAGHPTGRTN